MLSFLQTFYNFIDNLFYYGTIFIATVHSFQVIKMTKITRRTWQLPRYLDIIVTIFVPCAYFIEIFSNAWIKQREYIYGFIKSEKCHLILDSFLSLKVIWTRWYSSTWKCRILIGLIYALGVWYYPSIFWWYKLYSMPMIAASIGRFAWDFIYPFTIKNFGFQDIPFPIQQRFYELQPPLMRSRMAKAYFDHAMAPYYNQIIVEKCCIRNGPKCHELFESYNNASNHFTKSTTFCCSPDKTCSCPKSALKKLKVLNKLCSFSISANAFSSSISMFDYSNISHLYIYDCSFTQHDLEILPTMKLRYLILCLRNDNQRFDEKMVEILENVVGIPHLRLQYVGECWNPDKFEIFLVRWVLKNGYVESIVCSANQDFFRSQIIFKSCPKVRMFDKADDNIDVNE